MASPVLLNITVDLFAEMGYKYGLSAVLHPFMLGQHTAAVIKALRACREYYNIVVGRTETMVEDVVHMRAPESVALTT